MFRATLPRVYELKGLINDPSSPLACFKDFDENVRDSENARNFYERWEHTLQCLDDDAWAYLKNEASPRLTARDRRRGWESLFDILNQARAYGYLKRLDCDRVAFIPRRAQRTPDLEAFLSESRLLCEVKTINISDKEVVDRTTLKAHDIAHDVSPGFLRKLSAALQQAREQLVEYDPSRSARHIVYVDPCFDDHLGEHKAQYFRQVDQYLIEQGVQDVEIVMHNARTPFHKPVYMRAAAVDNEA